MIAFRILLFVFLCSACSVAPPNKNSNSAQTDETNNQGVAEAPPPKPKSYKIKLNNEDKASLYYSILLAGIADARHVYDVARDHYLKAAKITGHPAYSRSAVFASERLRDFETSLYAAELWSVQQPDDLQASEITTIGYLRKDQPKKALPHFMRLIDQLSADNNEQSYRSLLRLIRTVRTESTLRLLQLALKEKPNAAFLWLLSSQVALFLNDKGVANDAVNKALSLDPGFLMAVRQKAHLLFVDSRVLEAEELLLKQLQKQPQNREILVSLARLLYDIKDYDLASNYLNRILNIDPGDSEARYLLALCQHALQQWQSSLKHFRYSLQLGYQRDAALYLSGDAYEKLEQYSAALKMYQAISSGPHALAAGLRQAAMTAKLESPEAGLQVLQNLKAMHGEQDAITLARVDIVNQYFGLDEALVKVNQLLEQSPAHYPFRFKRLWLLLEQKAFNQAETIAREDQAFFRQRGNEVKYTATAAEYFKQAKRVESGIALLSEALERNPNNTDLLYSRALYSEIHGDYAQLEGDLRKILRLEPDSADAKNALGYTLIDLNKQLDEAERLVEQAYQKMPTNAAVIDSIGWLYFRKGQFDKAIGYLRRAARLDKNAEVVAHLVKALWYAGRKEEALDTLKRFVKFHPDEKKTNELLQTLRENQDP